jgi:acetyl esterase
MPLNAEEQAFLDQMAAANALPLHTLPVEAARQLIIDLFAPKGEREPVAKVEDRRVTGPAGPIPIRIYTPTGRGPFSSASRLPSGSGHSRLHLYEGTVLDGSPPF